MCPCIVGRELDGSLEFFSAPGEGRECVEIARRFDPTIDDANLPTTLDDAALFQLLAGWREKAWRNAELLAAAPTPSARELVVAAIENDAATEARSIAAATRYPPLTGGSGARDAFCPRRDQDVLLKAIAGSRLLAYENAGHALHWEEPARFAADLVAFVRSLTVRG